MSDDSGELSEGEDAPDPRALEPEAWLAVPDVCGSCIAWRAASPEPSEEVATGACKLRPEMGRVPADLPKCPQYMQRGGFKYDPARHQAPRRRRTKTLSVMRRGADGQMQQKTVRAPAARTDRDRSPPPRAPVPKEVELGEGASAPVIRQALVEIMREELGRPRREIASKYRGGRVEVHDDSGLIRTVKAEQFFSAIERFAASLDEIEEAASRVSSDAEVQSLTRETLGRIRGTMTTFNVLFASKEDHFRSK